MKEMIKYKWNSLKILNLGKKNCKDASLMITSISEGKVITVIPISCS